MNDNNTRTEILIIDDETGILDTLSDILGDEGYLTHTAANAEEARQKNLQHKPQLILLDIWMPDTDGISLLREWQKSGTLQCPVVIMSGHGTIETAVEATKLGAYDFLEKPLSSAKLLLTVQRALQTHNLQTQNAALKAKINPPAELIGKSSQSQELRRQAEHLADQNIPLLIHGNAGTGKQHLARHIHQKSSRRDAPFINTNLAAIDSNDIPAILLGTHKRPGLIAQADNGTLYLDEIGNLREDIQTTLQHLLEHHEYYPGDNHGAQTSEARIIAATRLPLNILKERLTTRLLQPTIRRQRTTALPPLQPRRPKPLAPAQLERGQHPRTQKPRTTPAHQQRRTRNQRGRSQSGAHPERTQQPGQPLVTNHPERHDPQGRARSL